MAVYKYNSQNGELERIAGGTLYSDAPIGVMQSFGGTVAPMGWFICDGSALSRTTYADLFAVIGTAFGSGDGSTTFNIPDMREAVPKGAGLTSKSNNHMDADGLAVGEFLDDRIQNITGSFVVDVEGLGCAMPKSEAGAFEGSNESTIRAISGSDTSLKGWQRMNLDASRVARTGATTEVKSVGVNWIIKAQSVGVPADFVDTIEDVIGDKLSYSTTEINTGRKWIDGKDVYRKTFAGTVTNIGYTTVASLTSLNIDKVLLIDQIFENENYVLTSYYNGGENCFRALIQKSNMGLIVNVSETNIDYKVTLEYTKTS